MDKPAIQASKPKLTEEQLQGECNKLLARIAAVTPASQKQVLTLLADVTHFIAHNPLKQAQKLALRTPMFRIYDQLLNHETKADLGAKVFKDNPTQVQIHKNALIVTHSILAQRY